MAIHFKEARQRAANLDRWRIKVENKKINRNIIITGGPGWDTRVSKGRIGRAKKHEIEKKLDFNGAIFRLTLLIGEGWSEVECDQPTSVLAHMIPVSVPNDAEAASIVNAVGNLSDTTTTNKKPGGYLSKSARLKIKALWEKKNGKKLDPGVKSKVAKMAKVIAPKVKLSMDKCPRFADLDLEIKPLKETPSSEVSERFLFIELD